MKKPCAELLRSARYWQDALKLNDWELHFREADNGELEAENSVARCSLNAATRSATISLRSLTKFDRELEEDLVHELIHIVFVQLSMWVSCREPIDQVLTEQGINTVADLLVRLRRKT